MEQPQTSGSPTTLASYRIFQLFARPEVCLQMLLLSIQCRWCAFYFCICRSCYRGHAYCSDECRVFGKRKRQSIAQEKYRQTQKGKRNHCEAENKRRQGLSKKNQRNMDDATTPVLPVWCIAILFWIQNRIFGFKPTPRCRFCGVSGRIVPAFPRRGYG